MKNNIFAAAVLTAMILTPSAVMGQQTLTLEDCRKMAIENNKELDQARTKVEMSEYDKKIAFANYLPNISAKGAYMYNNADIALISDETANTLTNAGTAVQTSFQAKLTEIQQLIASNPALAQEYMSSPLLQTLVNAASQADLSTAINSIGSEINDALHPDVDNICVGAVSLVQPVFMGGKIVAANKIANLAGDLAKTQYDQKYQEIVVDVDQAYWQIVSVANKKKLADAYADLLHNMENDVDLSVKAGVATESDALQIKVKANEADMLKTKADNGLVLAKMLLCKEIGLPLDSEIILADEGIDKIPTPQITEDKDMDAIYADRPETRSLDLATKIYDGKVNLARAEMLPNVALTANYIVTNPNLHNGFENKFGGFFAAGVVVNVPIFHGFEAQNKTRKAKAEAELYRSQYEDATNMINLQVTQLREQRNEAIEKLTMAENNLSYAEENLRTARIGFNEGVINTNTALAAQTAWLQAQSEYIDAGIELQMNNVNLQKAEGNYRSDIDK